MLLALPHDPASAQATKTLDRTYDPVVGTAGEFQVDEFLGKSIGGFEAWRYVAATSTWEQVPVQIDQRYYRDFDLVGYNIYRATQSGGPYTKLTLGGPIREQGYTGQLHPAGTTYYFVVRAVDAAGLESVASNEVALTGE